MTTKRQSWEIGAMVQTREEFWEKWEGLVPYWMKKYLAADLDTPVKAVQEQEREATFFGRLLKAPGKGT